MEYTENNVTLSLNGNLLRIDGELRYPTLAEYAKIKEFLTSIVSTSTTFANIKIDLTGLEYMNSSGQAIINLFILDLKRKTVNTSIDIFGTRKYEWQDKFLNTFTYLWKGKSESLIIHIT